MKDIVLHYDKLIDENNDPVYDPAPLKEYMDKWDGKPFIDFMMLNNKKSVLEIGVGTGRLAIRVAPLCKYFLGIDISSKTVEKAKQNLNEFSNTEIVCIDFMEYQTHQKFDVIYSSLTFMHIEDKKKAIEKIKAMLNTGGRFVLSIDKNQSKTIDYGTRKITIFPDQKETIIDNLTQAKMKVIQQYETELAHIFVASV